jgi:hypothetical protein
LNDRSDEDASDGDGRGERDASGSLRDSGGGGGGMHQMPVFLDSSSAEATSRLTSTFEEGVAATEQLDHRNLTPRSIYDTSAVGGFIANTSGDADGEEEALIARAIAASLAEQPPVIGGVDVVGGDVSGGDVGGGDVGVSGTIPNSGTDGTELDYGTSDNGGGVDDDAMLARAIAASLADGQSIPRTPTGSLLSFPELDSEKEHDDHPKLAPQTYSAWIGSGFGQFRSRVLPSVNLVLMLFVSPSFGECSSFRRPLPC